MVDGTGTTRDAYDQLGRLIQSVNGAGSRGGYGYDLRGNLTSLIYPDPARSHVTRTFDAVGRLSSVTDWAGRSTQVSYDPNGNLVGQAFPNGILETRGYDRADQLVQIVFRARSEDHTEDSS